MTWQPKTDTYQTHHTCHMCHSLHATCFTFHMFHTLSLITQFLRYQCSSQMWNFGSHVKSHHMWNVSLRMQNYFFPRFIFHISHFVFHHTWWTFIPNMKLGKCENLIHKIQLLNFTCNVVISHVKNFISQGPFYIGEWMQTMWRPHLILFYLSFSLNVLQFIWGLWALSMPRATFSNNKSLSDQSHRFIKQMFYVLLNWHVDVWAGRKML